MTTNANGPAPGARSRGAVNRKAFIVAGDLSSATNPNEFRVPLDPRVGVLVYGDLGDGLVVRFADQIHVGDPLRLSFEIVRNGVVERVLEFPLRDLAPEVMVDPDLFDEVQPVSGLACSNRAARRAIGLLLAAADKTVNVAGITPGFSMAGPHDPCPICGADGPLPGRARACVISEAGLVVCRGEPIQSGLVPLAAVGDCKVPGKLYVVGQPAASLLVVDPREAAGP
jgi:hypothetical protein